MLAFTYQGGNVPLAHSPQYCPRLLHAQTARHLLAHSCPRNDMHGTSLQSTCAHSGSPPNPLSMPQAVHIHPYKLCLITTSHPSSWGSPHPHASHFFTLNTPGLLNAGCSTDTHTHTYSHTHTHLHTHTHTHMHPHNDYPTVPGPPASTAEGCTARRAW